MLSHHYFPSNDTTGQPCLCQVAATAFLAYGLSNVTDSIWKGVPWSITAKFLFDGLLYGLTTGAIFAALWPAPTP